MNPAAFTLLLKGLDVLVLGIEMAPAIRALFQDITSSVRKMVAEERDPTLYEWTQLDKLRDEIHRQIQEAHR
ncbi:MAG: hypothetical protein V3V96_15500 [Acidiferrobacterales bacterium]